MEEEIARLAREVARLQRRVDLLEAHIRNTIGFVDGLARTDDIPKLPEEQDPSVRVRG